MVGLLKRVSRNMLLKMVKILEWDIFNCILKLIDKTDKDFSKKNLNLHFRENLTPFSECVLRFAM